MSDHDDHEFSLVMPFVVVTSAGGPLDDHAFVCGIRYANIEAKMARGDVVIEDIVPTDVVPQLDLAAMHHGYAFAATPWDEHPDEWTFVSCLANQATKR